MVVLRALGRVVRGWVVRGWVVHAWVVIAAAAAAAQAAPEPAAEPQDPVALGRLTAAAELQVFPTDISPRYAETLAEGAVVQVGRVHGDYREVILPLGVLGYVHKKFTSGLAEGAIAAETKLAFRYRPQSGEAPVAFVDQGTAFRVAGEEGDWWVVRYADGTAWVPAASLVVFDDGSANPTLTAAWEELARQHGEACDAAVAAMAAARQAVVDAERRRETLTSLQQDFDGEMAKPVREQQYGPLLARVDELIGGAGGDEQVLAAATRFRERVALQVTIVEATMVVGAEPPPAKVDVVPVRPVADPLARFAAVGWVDASASTGTGTVALMKGGQLLHHLTCSTGRYDLAKFDGLEVGLIGPRERPSLESLRVLDVEQIEVLSARR